MNVAVRCGARFFRGRQIGGFVVEMTFGGVRQIFGEMFGQMFAVGQMFRGEVLTGKMLDGSNVVEMFLIVQRKRHFFVLAVCGVQRFAGKKLDR